MEKTGNIIDRIPHDLRIESDLLGALLYNNNYYSYIRDMIDPEHFVSQHNSALFRVMVKFLQINKPVTESLLLAYIESNHLTEVVGGIEYLMTLQERLLDKEGVIATAKKLRELYLSRKTMAIALDIVDKCHRTQEDFTGTISALGNKLFSIINTGVDSNVISGEDACNGFIQRLMSEEGMKKIPTGFKILDALLGGGLSPRALVILAGRPSMGKTALAMNIANNVAQQKKATLIITIEMGNDELIARGVSQYSGFSFDEIRNREFLNREEDQKKVLSALRLISSSTIYFKEGISTVESIMACIDTLYHQRPIDFIVIDYLQLITLSGKKENRNTQISEITRSLKVLAVSRQIPILLLSQLSRDLEKRDDKRPMLSDLRDSGAIEQDADIVMFLYKDSEYNPQSKTPNEVELMISKNRNGRRGLVHKMEFDGKTASFREYEYNGPSIPQDYNDPRGNDL